jgi:hypothetical protein
MTKLPSAFVVLSIACASMMSIIAIAFVADCVRLDNVAKSLVNIADQDLLAHELRMVQLFKSNSSMSDELFEVIKDYSSSKVPSERHAAFRLLVEAFESSVVDDHISATGLRDSTTSTNPESLEAIENAKIDRTVRRLVDEARGISNRWSVSMQLYEKQVDQYNDYLQTRRGKIAAWLSRQ